MDRFQAAWLALSSPKAGEIGDDLRGQNQESSPKSGRSINHTSSASGGSDDDATVKAASPIAEGVFNHKLSPGEKKIAGPAVHYAVGSTAGTVYGVAAKFVPEVTKGLGLPYGTAFWLAVDEGAVPIFGLSKPPTDYEFSTHIYALVSHLVFGNNDLTIKTMSSHSKSICHRTASPSS